MSLEVVSPEARSAETATASESTWQVWARIGLSSFGGPAAQIALMHRVLVGERRWLDEAQFLRALGFCMLLPGPEAMQLATYAGWRRGGVRGGLMAGLWFVMPGAVLVTVLAALYVAFGQVAAVSSMFRGVKAAVLVLVFQAVARLAPRALRTPSHHLLAAGAFLALFFLSIPFPMVVAIAGATGALTSRSGTGGSSSRPSMPAWRASLDAIAVWSAIWLVPLLALATVVGASHRLTQIAVFFSKLAIVTFGGAYAVLSYMAQDVVARHGWLEARQMVDALGLAETTPGPLILVNLFVGSVALANAHPSHALALGLAGALVAMWATFAPCFLWIFAGAPHVERLAAAPRLRGALEAITAAVVGVIANLGLWFSLHVLFAEVRDARAGFFRWTMPAWTTFDAHALLLALVCAFVLLRFRWSMHRALGLSALLAWLLSKMP